MRQRYKDKNQPQKKTGGKLEVAVSMALPRRLLSPKANHLA